MLEQRLAPRRADARHRVQLATPRRSCSAAARWAVMAKRCASSRMRWTRNSPWLRGGSRMRVGRPGRKSSSRCLASPTTGTTSVSPNSASTSTATPSCPLPPSTISRSGSSFHARPDRPRLAARDRPTASSTTRRKRRRSTSRIEAKSSGSPWLPTALDVEAPVVALARHALGEDHHAADGVRCPAGCEMSKHSMRFGGRGRPSAS